MTSATIIEKSVAAPNPFHYRGWLIEEAKGIVFYWRAGGEKKFTAESVEDAKFMIQDFYS